jgi:hypothetical protein
MCVDVDTLAAWADGAMSGADRAAFEDHAAGCARCQALLAAMARTEAPPSAPAWWRRSPSAWLLPLATAAAVVGAVVIVDLSVPGRPASAPTAVVRSEPSAADRQLPPAAAPAAGMAPRADGRLPLSSTAPAMPSATPRHPERAAIDAQPSQAPAARRPKSEAVASAAVTRERSPVEPQAKDAAAQLAPVAAAPPAVPAAPAPPPPPSALRDEATRAETARAAVAPMLKAAAPVPILIGSPDRDVQWRIVSGVVEHTADGGVTWQVQPLGITSSIRAGSAPTARVCWLAGAGGVVLRTTDGATWIRIAFHEAADLIAIQASDAMHASVTAQSGVTFVTSDGGKTWIRQ